MKPAPPVINRRMNPFPPSVRADACMPAGNVTARDPAGLGHHIGTRPRQSGTAAPDTGQAYSSTRSVSRRHACRPPAGSRRSTVTALSDLARVAVAFAFMVSLGHLVARAWGLRGYALALGSAPAAFGTVGILAVAQTVVHFVAPDS